jgi:hypothetical protein
MLSRTTRHLSYANVVATLALVFAMAGSAIAAKHYLITSTSQISPKVLRALRGAVGRPGVAGPPGKAGNAGNDGASGKEGPSGKDGASLLSEAEQATLKGILPYVQYVPSGVGGKPTILFSGANVQIVNGAGATQTTDGAGNLVIGYDDEPFEQTGSHNLVLGSGQAYTSYGALLAGEGNEASAPYTAVFGAINEASGLASSVTGGHGSTASASYSSVTGGSGNAASGEDSSVTGGLSGTASGIFSVVTGGFGNQALGEFASVSGGKANKAEAKLSSIFGGKELTAKTEFEAIP